MNEDERRVRSILALTFKKLDEALAQPVGEKRRGRDASFGEGEGGNPFGKNAVGDPNALCRDRDP